MKTSSVGKITLEAKPIVKIMALSFVCADMFSCNVLTPLSCLNMKSTAE